MKYDDDEYDEKKENDEAFEEIKRNIERVTINAVKCNAKYKDERCLILDKCEMNKDLLRKLLVYKFGDETAAVENKLKEYQKWWDLQTAAVENKLKEYQKWWDLQTAAVENK
eukprot:978883_1